MPFNNNKFMKQNLEHRTESVAVPALADWFGKDEEAVWEVRGLSGAEVVRSNDAVTRNKDMANITEALVSNGDKEKVKALRQIIGNTDDVPADMAKRLDMIVNASINPEIDKPLAVKLAEHFPVEFMIITNKITVLTGMGSSMVKPKPSGKTNP